MSNSWENKEAESRKKKFIDEYEELTKKHNIRLMAFPEFVPSGQHGFNVSAVLVPIDMKDRPVPSPLADDKGKVL